MLIGQHQREAEQRYATASDRLVWTGAAVNGAVLIAFANIVAGVESPDSALRALAVPMLLAGVGMIIGANAVQEAVAAAAANMLEALHRDQADRAYEEARLGPDLFERPINPDDSSFIFGDAGDDQARRMLAELMKLRMEKAEAAGAAFETAIDGQAAAGRDRLDSEARASRLQRLAALFAGVSVIWAVAQSFLGVQLQPPAPAPIQKHTPPLTQTPVSPRASTQQH